MSNTANVEVITSRECRLHCIVTDNADLHLKPRGVSATTLSITLLCPSPLDQAAMPARKHAEAR